MLPSECTHIEYISHTRYSTQAVRRDCRSDIALLILSSVHKLVMIVTHDGITSVCLSPLCNEETYVSGVTNTDWLMLKYFLK